MSQHSFGRADGTGCRCGELPAWLSCRHGHTSGTRGPGDASSDSRRRRPALVGVGAKAETAPGLQGVGRQKRRGQGGAFPKRTEGWECQGINI